MAAAFHSTSRRKVPYASAVAADGLFGFDRPGNQTAYEAAWFSIRAASLPNPILTPARFPHALLGAEHPSQHHGQDAPMPVVLDLDRCVEAHDGRELPR